MSTHLFVLGHQPKISTAEITAVFSLWKIDFDITNHFENNLIIETKKDFDTQKLMSCLGGTIKIGRLIDEDIKDFLLQKQSAGKIVFSVSGSNAQKKALEIKKELKSLEKSVRYVEAKNTATILHNNLVEKQGDFTIVNNQIFITEAIQPFEEFGERDYGRPQADSRSGMLPPKLARMLINLCQAKPKDIILDPFCGSGTILAEAMALGFKNLIGSDVSNKAIDDTKKNLSWLENNLQPLDNARDKSLIFNLKIFQADARSLPQDLAPNFIDTIITEPFLGQPLNGRETKDQLQKQAGELAKLYIESFKSFAKILKPNATVIFIIPSFRFNDSWIRINFIEEIKKHGFTPVSFDQEEYLLYWREKQYVGREIWKFKFSI